MSLSDQEYTFNEIINVMIYDQLAWLKWSKTVDGSKNRNMPESLASKLFGEKKEDNGIKGFANAEDFEAARKRLIEQV